MLVNGASGAGTNGDLVPAIEELFLKAGLDAKVLLSRNGAHMTELAAKAAAENHPIVVAGGGDGTVSTVAAAVARSDSALGVLPLGTLNHFARDVGIPLQLEEAVRTIAAGHLRLVDVGEVNGRIFINNSSIGLYPTLVIRRESQRRRLGRSKWHALFWASLQVLRRHPMLDIKLRLEALVERRRTPLVFVGNNEYAIEGFDIGTRPRLDAGTLSIYLVKRHGRWGLLGLALRALVRRLRQALDFELLQAQTIGIDTRHRALPVATDGEVTMMQMPLDYRIHPRALRVIAPLSQPAA